MSGIEALFAQGEMADIYYCDPPWGPGMMKMFDTMNRKHDPAQPAQEADYAQLLAKVLQDARRFAKGPVFIQYGVKWEKEVRDLASAAGLTHVATVEAGYASGNGRQHIHIFWTSQPPPLPAGYLEQVRGTTGWDTARVVTAPFAVPGGILFDPCCGFGASAKAAVGHGMRFYGNELNAVRLARTAAWLKKAG